MCGLNFFTPEARGPSGGVQAVESRPQRVVPPLLTGVSFGENGLPWGAACRTGGAARGREVPGPAPELGALRLPHWGSGLRARPPLRGHTAPCPAPSQGEPALRASFPPASGGLSPRPLQLLRQLLPPAAAGSAGRAPERLGLRGRGRGGAGGSEEEAPAEAEEAQRCGDALREQGLATVPPGARTRRTCRGPGRTGAASRSRAQQVEAGGRGGVRGRGLLMHS